jgi:signal recognition particle subunit SRP54
MLDNLQVGLSGLGSLFGGKTTKLDEASVQQACQTLRRALMEADVSVRVARQFVQRVRDTALNTPELEGWDAEDQFMGIMHQELTTLLGEAQTPLKSLEVPVSGGSVPRIILMCGLQGAGKTTTSAKLAKWLSVYQDAEADEATPPLKPYLIAADTVRPAAMEQLSILATRLGIPCYLDASATDMLSVVTAGIQQAKAYGATHIIVDTAGRLQADSETMADLYLLKKTHPPTDVVLVVDAMIGQESVHVVEAFNTQIGVTGCILSKMDGDTKGGAMLSIRDATGLPILFLGMGEQPDDLEPFHPDRMAQRLMGMGDLATLFEKAMSAQQEGNIAALSGRVMQGQLNFQDYVAFQQHMDKLGGIGGIMSMLPMMKLGKDERQAMTLTQSQKMRQWRAVLDSMKQAEALTPELVLNNENRQARIFAGAGLSLEAGKALLNDFQGMYQMAQSMKAMASFFGGGDSEDDDDEAISPLGIQADVSHEDDDEDPMGWGEFFSAFNFDDDDEATASSDRKAPKKAASEKSTKRFGLPW